MIRVYSIFAPRLRMDMKNKLILKLLLALTIGFGACTREKDRILTPIEVKAKVDSLTAVKVAAIKQQAKEDLDVRIAIEVKPKADSIVEARRHPRKDTTKAKQLPPMPNMAKQLIPMNPLQKTNK